MRFAYLRLPRRFLFCVPFLLLWLSFHRSVLAETGPPPATVTNHSALKQGTLSKPPVRVPTPDPIFGKLLVRVTDAALANRPGLFPDYAKRQAWNSDETLMLLRSDDGTVGLFDGETYEFRKIFGRVGGEDIFWHPFDRQLLYYNPGNALYEVNVTTEEETLVHEFTAYSFANTRGEGNLSRDGRLYAVVGQIYNAATEEVHFRALVLFDILLKREVAELRLPEQLASFDWVSISPLGNFVVVDYATREPGRFNGVEVYDSRFNFLWQKPLGAGHSDLGLDGQGEEVLVMDVYDEVRNETIFKKVRLRDGQETELLALSPLFDQHISCRGEGRAGWCVISTFDYLERLEDETVPWLPFEDEIFALKLDGSRQVERLAHHRSRRFSPEHPDSDRSIYFAEPHATVSRRGDRVLFGSNWRQNIGTVGSIDPYVVDLRARPGLRIYHDAAANTITLAWSASWPEYSLESRAAFDPAHPWQAVDGMPSKVADQLTLTLPGPAGTVFYRVGKP